MSLQLRWENKLISFSKALLALSVGTFALLVGIDNVIDFNTNYQFVKHVLSMDAMQSWFTDRLIESRAIHSSLIHLLAYYLIISLEIIAGIICLTSGIVMLIAKNEKRFDFGRSLYTTGGSLCLLLWFFGFCVIGAEWFSMWANQWNGQMKAYTISIFILSTMIFINQN